MQLSKPFQTAYSNKWYLRIFFITVLLLIFTFSNLSQAAGENPNSAKANDILKLGSEIKGHQEQPKVLFILPWQTPETDVPDAIQTPQLIPEYLLAPIDRAEFNRQSYLLEALKK